MPTTWTDVSKPTTTWTESEKAASYLLINATDFLLINSDGDYLITASDGNITWTDVAVIA